MRYFLGYVNYLIVNWSSTACGVLAGIVPVGSSERSNVSDAGTGRWTHCLGADFDVNDARPQIFLPLPWRRRAVPDMRKRDAEIDTESREYSRWEVLARVCSGTRDTRKGGLFFSRWHNVIYSTFPAMWLKLTVSVLLGQYCKYHFLLNTCLSASYRKTYARLD